MLIKGFNKKKWFACEKILKTNPFHVVTRRVKVPVDVLNMAPNFSQSLQVRFHLKKGTYRVVGFVWCGVIYHYIEY